MALAVHDLTVVDSVGPAQVPSSPPLSALYNIEVALILNFLPSTQRGKVDFFAHNKKKDRLAETAMLYFTLTVSAPLSLASFRWVSSHIVHTLT
jgi:hypothetical protein